MIDKILWIVYKLTKASLIYKLTKQARDDAKWAKYYGYNKNIKRLA